MVDVEPITRLREYTQSLAKKLGAFDKDDASCCGITVSQYRVLLEISKNSHISINKLAQILDLDKSTMSRMVTNLVEKGWATRDIDQQDRRYMSVKLTDEGRNLVGAIESRINRFYLEIYNSIPENRREQVLESLHILIEALPQDLCC